MDQKRYEFCLATDKRSAYFMIVKNKMTGFYVCIYICILLVGIFLRAPEILSRNYLFGFDQGRDYLAVRSIVEDRKLTLIGAEVGAGSAGLRGLFHGPGYFYLLVPFYVVFAGDPYGGMVLMFLFGSLSIVVTIVLSISLFGPLWGLLPSFFISISPHLVTQSRFIWNHHLTTPLILLVFLLLTRYHTKPNFYGPLALFVSGLLYHFELAISVPMVLGVFLWILATSKLRSWKLLTLSLLSVFIAFAPMILFEIRHDFMATRGILQYLTGNSGSSSVFSETRIVSHMRDYVNNIISSFKSSSYLGDEMTIYIIGIAVCMVFVFWKRITPFHRRFLMLMGSILGITFGIFMFLDNVIWDYYLIHLHIIYTFLFTTGVLYAYRIGKPWVKSVSVALILLLFANGFFGTLERLYNDYTGDYFDYGGYHKIRGKKDILDDIYRDAGKEPFSVQIFVPPIYYFDYDYMFRWYGQKNYQYMPEFKNSHVTYLIIEIDTSKPWRHVGWLETVIKTGVIEKEWVHKSGVIIQKRRMNV